TWLKLAVYTGCPRRNATAALYTGVKSSVIDRLVLSTQLRWMTAMIAIGHSTDRSTVAALGGEVRGRNALSNPARNASVIATSAPYTVRPQIFRQAGQ